MQIVIDIPWQIKATLNDENQWSALLLAELKEIVNKGKPLPKGHGRLIDADEIQFENAEFDTYGDYSRAFDAIDQADTIIEADREVTNG